MHLPFPSLYITLCPHFILRWLGALLFLRRIIGPPFIACTYCRRVSIGVGLRKRSAPAHVTQ